MEFFIINNCWYYIDS
ncbi:hypothetical protein [Convivina intestini]